MIAKSRRISSKLGDNQLWQMVKIKGNVISDDGGGCEGLIGLEVLENYGEVLVKRDKKKITIKKQKKEPKPEKPLKKRKSSEDCAENVEVDVQPWMKEKKSNNRTRKVDNTTRPSNNYPDRFILSNPTLTAAGDREEENSDKVDELEGWTGLGVPYPILKSLAEKGFKYPTDIQAKTLPAAIFGKKDILGAAVTGSGKTLAFGIPILTGIIELKAKNIRSGIRKASAKPQIKKYSEYEKKHYGAQDKSPVKLSQDECSFENDYDEKNDKPLYAVVLTPTRELAVQVRDHLITAAQYTDIKVAAVFGGLSIAKQERVLKSCPEIVVATPGRFWELLQQENSHLNKIDNISFLVIDETDRMVEKGHFEELKLLLSRLNTDEDRKKLRQNFVFSATLTMMHHIHDYSKNKKIGKKNKLIKLTPNLKIQRFIEELGISQPKIVDVTTARQTAHKLTECRLVCSFDQKDFYLYYFVQRHPGRTIVFCNSINCVKRLATLYGLLNCRPLALHASMIQKQRLKNLERFRENPDGLLIATDVAARGLDIQNVQHVIHYQVPRTSENYVHRSGRTARANCDGITVMLMEPGEVKCYVKLCNILGRHDDLPIFPVADQYLAPVRQRVKLARKVDKLELELRQSQCEIGWIKKNSEETEIIVENTDDDCNVSNEDDALNIEKKRKRQILQRAKEELRKLLRQQIFPKNFSYRYPTNKGMLEMTTMCETDAQYNDNSAVNIMKIAMEH